MSEYKTKQSEHKLKAAAIVCNARTDLASPTVPRTSYDLRVLQSLRRIIRAVALHSRKLSMQHNITGPQLACLLAVNEHGPLTASSLAREVHLSPSTIVGILDRLEQKGLVLRQRSSQDRRVINIAITTKGRELANSTPSPLQDTLAKALKGLPEIDQVSIVLSLEKVVALMEVEDLDAAPVLETDFLINKLSEEKHKA